MKNINDKNENEKLAFESRDSKKFVNPAMPVRVFIATTNKCNLKCPVCPNSESNKGKELPYEVFLKLADELFPLAKEYHTTVSGEPLLTSYFKEIPSILLNYNTKMNLTTNGMMLTEDISRLIMPVLNDIKISFDGATKKTFEKIRPGSNLEIIVNNINNFIKIRSSSIYKPTLTLQTTLMRDNVKELPEIVKIAYDLGADRIKAYFMIVYNPEYKDKSLWFHKKLTNEYLEIADGLAKSYGLKSKLPKKFNLEESSNKYKFTDIICHFLWQEAWIEVNGDIISCCNIDRYVMGNIYENSFSQIWNNKIYQDMRKRLNTDNPYECCKDCALVNEFRLNGMDYSYKSLISKRCG